MYVQGYTWQERQAVALPLRGHKSHQLQPQSQGSKLGDIFPLKKMLFPSCDPAQAWESAQDCL